MKRIAKTIVASMTAAVLAASSASAAGTGLFTDFGQEYNMISGYGIPEPAGDVIALDDIGISVTLSDYKTVRQSDGFVYIFPREDQAMPYVIIGRYDTQADNFADAFTAYMAGNHPDIRVASEPAPVTINNNVFSRIVYEYTTSGYTVTDTRLFLGQNGYTYMFGSKEVPALGFYLSTGYLDQTAQSFAMLSGGYSDYQYHVDAQTSVEGKPEMGGVGGDILVDTPEDGGSSTEDTGNVESIDEPEDEFGGSIVFKESAAAFNGSWISFDDGFKLYMPNNWTQYPLSAEQRQQGALFLAYDGNVASNPPYIEVDWTSSEGISTLDGLADDLRSNGYQVDDKLLVNGFPCVSYSSSSSNISGLMFFHPQTTDYVFVVIAGAYSTSVDTLAAILCSLSPN